MSVGTRAGYRAERAVDPNKLVVPKSGTAVVDARVRKRIKRNKRPEDEIQVEVVRRLRAAGVTDFHHTPNPGKLTFAAACKQRAMGLQADVSDLVIWSAPPAVPGAPHAALELKAAGRTASVGQLEWLARRGNEGWAVAVAVGLEEAIAQLETWGYLPRT